MKEQLISLLLETLQDLQSSGELDTELPDTLKIDRTRDPAHGDMASNVAMMLAKKAGVAPRDLAQKILDALPATDWLEKAEIAGPGFINFFLKSDAANAIIGQVLSAGEGYGCNESGNARKADQEYLEFIYGEQLIVHRIYI